jgi:hypothetical protein
LRPAKIATSGKWVKGKLFSQRHPTLPMPLYTAHTRAALPHPRERQVCWRGVAVVGRHRWPWGGPGTALCCQARQQSPSTFASGLRERNRLSTRFPPQPPTAFLQGAEVSSLSSTLLSLHLPPPFPHPRHQHPTPVRLIDRSLSRAIDSIPISPRA